MAKLPPSVMAGRTGSAAKGGRMGGGKRETCRRNATKIAGMRETSTALRLSFWSWREAGRCPPGMRKKLKEVLSSE
jgi:hypothetical protein